MPPRRKPSKRSVAFVREWTSIFNTEPPKNFYTWPQATPYLGKTLEIYRRALKRIPNTLARKDLSKRERTDIKKEGERLKREVATISRLLKRLGRGD